MGSQTTMLWRSGIKQIDDGIVHRPNPSCWSGVAGCCSSVTGFAAYEGLSGYLSADRETVSGYFPVLMWHETFRFALISFIRNLWKPLSFHFPHHRALTPSHSWHDGCINHCSCGDSPSLLFPPPSPPATPNIPLPRFPFPSSHSINAPYLPPPRFSSSSSHFSQLSEAVKNIGVGGASHSLVKT